MKGGGDDQRTMTEATPKTCVEAHVKLWITISEKNRSSWERERERRTCLSDLAHKDHYQRFQVINHLKGIKSTHVILENILWTGYEIKNQPRQKNDKWPTMSELPVAPFQQQS